MTQDMDIFWLSKLWVFVKLILLGWIISMFMILLADPNIVNTKQNIQKNGIDMVVVFDVSKSMEAEDLKPSRIDAAKALISQFIGKLSTDRVGLVVFAGKPYTSVPLTFDYDILQETLDDIDTDSLNQSVAGLDGTAIGDALLMAKNIITIDDKIDGSNGKRNKDELEREKVILLFTDGDANRWVDPLLVTEAIKDEIKVYTIGIGSLEWGVIAHNFGWFVQRQMMAPLKEDTLRQIAQMTNAKFFRATDNKTFAQIFEELSMLEKHKIDIEVHKEYRPYYKMFVYILLSLLFVYTVIIWLFINPQD